MKKWMTVMVAGMVGVFAQVCMSGVDGASWTSAKSIEVEKLAPFIQDMQATDSVTLQQPTTLAFKAALYLAGGSAKTPTRGTRQTVDAKYSGGEEHFTSAVVTVEFMGYADDSLSGERFVLHLDKSDKSVWVVKRVERTACGRGDHR